MHRSRVIRIEAIQYDALSSQFEGTAILRDPNGAIIRRRLSAPGDPAWTHGHARRALTRQAVAG
jgi:hypothetical protein